MLTAKQAMMSAGTCCTDALAGALMTLAVGLAMLRGPLAARGLANDATDGAYDVTARDAPGAAALLTTASSSAACSKDVSCAESRRSSMLLLASLSNIGAVNASM